MAEKPKSAPSACSEAAKLGAAGKHEKAWKIVSKLLIDDPLNVPALITASYLMRRMGALPAAYHYARAAAQLWPQDDAAWTNLGHAASEMWRPEEAEDCYKRGLKCSHQTQHIDTLMLNLSALYIDNGRFEEAEALCQKILATSPEHRNAQANLGFCQLAQRNWAEGWKGYHHTIGSEWRTKIQYNGEPEWDGSPGKVVAIYGDQGIGDEISFASIVPDAIACSTKVIVDCDPRLEGLFRRSFPKAKVYGTRQIPGVPYVERKWDREDWAVEASIPIGQLGEFFRTTAESFPGTPYLTPCPSRTQMWKGLFTQKRKPIIGIAWTGGIPKTNARNRRVTLEDFLPLFLAVEAHYVSLQYKDAQAEIDAFKARYAVDIEQYRWATLTQDYDDTAALVASCDYVLCIQTAVAHTAAAMGIPVTVMIPTATTWRYGKVEPTIPWYESLRCIRQEKHGHWRHEFDQAAREIRAYLGCVPRAAADNARSGPLRDGLDLLCADSVGSHQSNGSAAPA